MKFQQNYSKICKNLSVESKICVYANRKRQLDCKLWICFKSYYVKFILGYRFNRFKSFLIVWLEKCRFSNLFPMRINLFLPHKRTVTCPVTSAAPR